MADNFEPYLFESLINTIPGSVYWKDINGFYLGCNDVVIKKGNLSSRSQIVGKTDYDIWPEFAEQIRKNDIEVIKQNITIETEETVVLKNGECFFFSSVKSPLRDNSGNIIGIIGNSIDITELKRAKQQAEAASQAKSQFLALMGHELRIPLTGIISTANLMLEAEIDGKESRELIKIIEDSGSYLLSTIDTILDFSKLEAEKFEIFPANLNIKELMENICSILTASAREKKLTLETYYDPKLPPQIISDFRVIRHIMTNLIGNAIKYTEKGNIIVNIKVVQKTSESIKLEFIVEDTGIGIPKDKLDYIFDRFSQVENTYTRKQSRSGTGLGLSIVKKFVTLLNSQICVTSKVGKGSRFYFVADFALPELHNSE